MPNWRQVGTFWACVQLEMCPKVVAVCFQGLFVALLHASMQAALHKNSLKHAPTTLSKQNGESRLCVPARARRAQGKQTGNERSQTYCLCGTRTPEAAIRGLKQALHLMQVVYTPQQIQKLGPGGGRRLL